MMIASYKRGLAAGMMSAVFALATGPAALAQAGRSNAQQPTRTNAKPLPAKPNPAPATNARSTPAAKPAAAAGDERG